jgi:putative ABC transport system ATP-binding protein
MINVKKLVKDYKTGDVVVKALRGASFDIEEGEFVAIMGSSGSGKSTLLHLLGLLDEPTSGSYHINKEDMMNLSENGKSEFRLRELGYVFQEFALLGELTNEENVLLSPYMSGKKLIDAKNLAKSFLNKVGLKEKALMFPSQLSGGQQQRVAIARGIVNSPKILFADEPCANLDTENSKQILDLFRKLNKELKLTIVMVTHEDWHIDYVSRVIKLKDGEIVSDRYNRKK